MSKNSAKRKSQPAPMEAVKDVQLSAESSDEKSETQNNQNVSRRERIASGVVGGGLLFYGIPQLLTLPGQVSSLSGLYLLGRAVTGRCLVYSALGVDSTPKGRLHHLGLADPHPVQMQKTIQLARSPHDAFEFFQDHDQVALCFPTVRSIKPLEHNRSLWMFSDTAELLSIPVTVEITHEVEAKQITWLAFPDSQFRLNGTIEFKETGTPDTTDLVVTVHMIPPAGIMGATLMKWLSPVTEEAVANIMDRMKELMETGTIQDEETPNPQGIKDPVGGWPSRFRSHLHVRTMQSLVRSPI